MNQSKLKLTRIAEKISAIKSRLITVLFGDKVARVFWVFLAVRQASVKVDNQVKTTLTYTDFVLFTCSYLTHLVS